jgi:hypothetical protein
LDALIDASLWVSDDLDLMPPAAALELTPEDLLSRS